jgi:hypothetical protein
MARHSIVGSGSLIPEDVFLRKQEVTCLFEDPELLTNHFRNTLKDLRPDKPFFDSDQPRYNNYSRDRLNLRHHGRRSTAEPYLPEGTFLDHEFTIKDPRGIATGPDMMQYRRQQEARGKFIKHGNDEDNSVPSSGWNPSHVVRDIKGQFYNLKERMKIFDESMDGRHNGGAAQTKLISTGVCMQETSERKPIMRDEMCYNRSNVINDLSNNTSIGWRRTTDHRFQVAKYGQIRSNAPLSTQDWSKNRANARLEHDVLLSWKDQNVSKQLTLKMIDMARKKYNDIESGKTVLFSQSKDSQMSRSKKLSSNDLVGVKSQTDETRAPDPNSLLYSEQAPYKMAHPTLDNKKMDKVIIDPFIVDYMSSINRKMAPREMDDLRENIEQSGESHGVLIEQKNKMCNPQIDVNNELLWESEANYEKGRSMNVANYSKIAANTFINPRNQDNIDYEKYTKNSKITGQRRGQLLNNMYNMEVVDYDNAYGKEVNAVKQIGNMGTKYVRHFIDKGDIEYNMGDITATAGR